MSWMTSFKKSRHVFCAQLVKLQYIRGMHVIYFPPQPTLGPTGDLISVYPLLSPNDLWTQICRDMNENSRKIRRMDKWSENDFLVCHQLNLFNSLIYFIYLLAILQKTPTVIFFVHQLFIPTFVTFYLPTEQLPVGLHEINQLLRDQWRTSKDITILSLFLVGGVCVQEVVKLAALCLHVSYSFLQFWITPRFHLLWCPVDSWHTTFSPSGSACLWLQEVYLKKKKSLKK